MMEKNVLTFSAIKKRLFRVRASMTTPMATLWKKGLDQNDADCAETTAAVSKEPKVWAEGGVRGSFGIGGT